MSNLKNKDLDPYKDAYEEFKILKSNRDYYLKLTFERVISENPYLEKKELIEDVKNYYLESLERIPSYEKYPESKEWVDYVLKKDKLLMELANLTLEEIAIYRSLNSYLQFRGYRKFGLKKSKFYEKCRVAFIRETDFGPMHIKNIDDPIDYWNPYPKLPEKMPLSEVWWEKLPFIIDSVGSGLHIDDEPKEIFPLPIFKMVYKYAYDIGSCVDFLKKYSIFWGSCNIIIFDLKCNFCVIEKCSRNFIDIYPDNKSNFGYISGMVCRDKDSPQAKYQREKRIEYLKLFNFSNDALDVLFWELCEMLDKKLKEGIESLGNKPSSEEVINLFISPYPKGLRKFNLKQFNDWTLYTQCTFFEKKILKRWQLIKNRDSFEWTEKPEICIINLKRSRWKW